MGASSGFEPAPVVELAIATLSTKREPSSAWQQCFRTFRNRGRRELRATAPPLGQRRADHQLDLMEEHEREDGRAHGM